jgi:hypothetical protein
MKAIIERKKMLVQKNRISIFEEKKFPSTSIVLLHTEYITHKAMKIVELLPT